MARVVVLGGAGAVGSVAASTLAKQDLVDKVVIADFAADRAAELAAELGDKAEAATVDVEDDAALRAVLDGADVVLNCVGPFYKTVKRVLSTVMELGIPYIDVCDDVDVTLEILDWDAKAKEAGLTAVIGMGNSPGATNLLAKFAATALLDETEAVDIFHAHGGEAFEGAGVIGHRFHCMSIPIPMYLDGELKYVNYFEPDGIALRQSFDFPVLGDGIQLYPYPHPEQVTLPRYLDLRQVTNKGTVLPAAYYDLTRDLCQLGLASREPLEVEGRALAPYDFAVSYIIRERERLLAESGFGGPKGCCSVVVTGTRRGEFRQYRFHMASQSQALGEGTGIPAAVGTLLLLQGKVKPAGVLPPEGCMDPSDFIATIPQVMTLDSRKEGGTSFGGVIVQQVDAEGNVTTLDI